MTDVHARIHAVKEVESRNHQFVGSDKANPFDPTEPVADQITKETWLLCFDEFQVQPPKHSDTYKLAHTHTYVQNSHSHTLFF